ncbi:hypothetical protein TNCV_3599041 [Trichonephila clavipes]|nr:hypothetical protein TNCV_3599041 [Trichonephila clavipes]
MITFTIDQPERAASKLSTKQKINELHHEKTFIHASWISSQQPTTVMNSQQTEKNHFRRFRHRRPSDMGLWTVFKVQMPRTPISTLKGGRLVTLCLSTPEVKHYSTYIKFYT